jgi:hypothetical protein
LIWHLDRWSQDSGSHWANDTLVFLREVWPRQIAAKTPRCSARLCELAFLS